MSNQNELYNETHKPLWAEKELLEAKKIHEAIFRDQNEMHKKIFGMDNMSKQYHEEIKQMIKDLKLQMKPALEVAASFNDAAKFTHWVKVFAIYLTVLAGGIFVLKEFIRWIRG